ncbi:hypothetical protein [Aneurinibacillus tyrosinisolvens]|uniref:hypothetical protein n=1 Tax=Aneurinibacillus tyrosinisolvens TaxID=1443435 RepID=UPI00063F766E|nr:hypothetical protein [Aneurinibacillus tyrosinisolvens]
MATNNKNAVEHGLNAAQAHATDNQEQQHVEQLASQLQNNQAGATNAVNATNAANATNTTAATDADTNTQA